MKYVLNSDLALRSWQHRLYGLIRKGGADIMRVTPELFLTLLDFDGKHEISPDTETEKLLENGVIREAAEGKSLSSWQQYWNYDNEYFPEMNWMLTGKCNYNCLHCFNAADNAPLMAEWGRDEAIRLLDDAENCGIMGFTLTGGEPMMHPHFMEIVRGIYERSMFVKEINTNGYFITGEMLEELKSFGCDAEMKISFDGLGHHDWMRARKGAEVRTLAAIRLCLEHGFRVRVQMNVNRGNLDAVLETLEKLDEMGVSRTRIIRTSESPRWLKTAPDMTLSVKEYYDAMLDVLEKYTGGQHNMDIRAWQFADIFMKNRSFTAYCVRFGEGEYKKSAPVCLLNRRMVGVTAEGEVVPCLQMSGYYKEHGISLGNVKDKRLKSILAEGDYFEAVCQSVEGLKEKNGKCAACRYFKYCGGGCRALGLAMNDDLNGSDLSKCIFFENGYHRKLKGILPGWTDLKPIDV